MIRRAAALARTQDAQLLVVHVQVSDGLAYRLGPDLGGHQKPTAEPGGTYTQIAGPSPAQTLAETARAQGATTVVVGRHRSRLVDLAHGSVSARLRRLLPATTVEEVRKT